MQTARDLIFPPRCLACGGLTAPEGALCGPCWRETPFVTGLSCGLCGLPLPGEGGPGARCDDCLRITRPWAAGRAALLYRGRARELVLQLKHADRHDIAPAAGAWMARAGAPILSQDCLLVPIPLHPLRLIRRRYNQSALLAGALARETGLTAAPRALRRHRATPSLDGLRRDDRFSAVTGSISVTPGQGNVVSGRDVVLVDDVLTSGATFAAATTALLAAGAQRVCVLALARVAKDA
ncbi:double zinc ribbon domain-containing protein [Roseivivax sp. GX 12232]|uniref:double zinc ribbon domain-containing protein n=1 Tax=Roseivivax sp. GX 12232 TaxID=2900547 RepID=UPI001E653709|nr:double zinc ribbon domain-containing protein [Roseivivax sp. GX 12232]MCE0506347.1 double zinc ribbon domain-containing protein [Roseivivax sp. GX 12232]